jgi:arginine/lysine/histidine transporter system substrate-binding protein
MIKKFKSKLVLMLVLIMVSISFAGCSQKTAVESNAGTETQKMGAIMEKVKSSGKLVLGTSADYPPYEFHKVTNGKDEIVGFDIEIAKEIAKDLGVELVIKDMKFDGLLAALETGNIDLVIAGMNPTEERKKSVDFSAVYYQAEQSVLIRTEDKDKYKSLSDLSGKRVGVQKGTTQEQVATDEIPGAQLKALGKVTDLVLQLQNDMVDAVVLEQPVATSYAGKNKGILVSDLYFDNKDKGAAAAIKKGNEDFVNEINKTLNRLMNDKLIEKFVVDANNIVD